MVLKLWRFATIVLCALLVTLGFGHLWQLAPRMAYDAPMWFVTLDLYEQFGPAGPGPVIEVGALFTTAVLAVMVRSRAPAYGLTVLAAGALGLGMAIWWAVVFPVDEAMAGWTLETIPPDWTALRARWEYAHAARAILSFLSLGAFTWSVILETPSAVGDELELGAAPHIIED
jgi:hypothetical protein